MELPEGSVIGGKYRIVRLLGKGGMGSVYEGQPTSGATAVAIKVLHAHLADDQRSLARFEREAQAAGRIGSAHIVQVLDVGKLRDGSPYMVMELCIGETLRRRIKRCGAMSPEALLPLVSQLLDGLHVAHQAGIIHPDLKPHTVFLAAGAPGRPADFVKILDFGVSKLLGGSTSEALTQTGDMLGTPYFMAPEQAKGERGIDHRVDLYSVGVLLYRALAGRYPFKGANAAELFINVLTQQPPDLCSVAAGVDAEVARIVHRAMAREAADRHPSAAALAADLRSWRSGVGAPSKADPAAPASRTELIEPVEQAGVPQATVALVSSAQASSAQASSAQASSAQASSVQASSVQAPSVEAPSVAAPSFQSSAAAGHVRQAPPSAPQSSPGGSRPSHHTPQGSWQQQQHSGRPSWGEPIPSGVARPSQPAQPARAARPHMSTGRKTAALGCGMLSLFFGLLFAGCTVIRFMDVGQSPASTDLANLITKPERSRVKLRGVCMLNDVQRVAGPVQKCFFPMLSNAEVKRNPTPRDYAAVRVLVELSCSEMSAQLGSKAVARALPKACKLDVLWSELSEHTKRKLLEKRFHGIDQAIVARPYGGADVAVMVGIAALAALLLAAGIGLSIKVIRN